MDLDDFWGMFSFPSRAREPYGLRMPQHGQNVFFGYIISSLSGTLYVGLTDNLTKRLQEHRDGVVDSFTRKYNIHRLMYYEVFRDAGNAQDQEKQLKKFRRQKKIALFTLSNPKWVDLGDTLGWLSKDLLM